MSYKTIKEFAQNEFIERKSRFIGYVSPAKTEEDAQKFIAEISKLNHDATHNVYAYVLRDGQIRRYSDNGEPQGTAGIPVLDVLLKSELTDIVCVVTRYFGGIMLGAGGLVRAYSHAAKIACDNATIMNMTEAFEVLIESDYSFYGKLMYLLKDYKAVIKSTDFLEMVNTVVIISEENYNRLLKDIIEISNGQVEPKIVDKYYYDI